jgi:hypothetical protein
MQTSNPTRAFLGFWQAKFPDEGSVLGSIFNTALTASKNHAQFQK